MLVVWVVFAVAAVWLLLRVAPRPPGPTRRSRARGLRGERWGSAACEARPQGFVLVERVAAFRHRFHPNLARQLPLGEAVVTH